MSIQETLEKRGFTFQDAHEKSMTCASMNGCVATFMAFDKERNPHKFLFKVEMSSEADDIVREAYITEQVHKKAKKLGVDLHFMNYVVGGNVTVRRLDKNMTINITEIPRNAPAPSNTRVVKKTFAVEFLPDATTMDKLGMAPSDFEDVLLSLCKAYATLWHSTYFTHNDFHPGNILYTMNRFEAVMIDYGRAHLIQKPDSLGKFANRTFGLPLEYQTKDLEYTKIFPQKSAPFHFLVLNNHMTDIAGLLMYFMITKKVEIRDHWPVKIFGKQFLLNDVLTAEQVDLDRLDILDHANLWLWLILQALAKSKVINFSLLNSFIEIRDVIGASNQPFWTAGQLMPWVWDHKFQSQVQTWTFVLSTQNGLAPLVERVFKWSGINVNTNSNVNSNVVSVNARVNIKKNANTQKSSSAVAEKVNSSKANVSTSMDIDMNNPMIKGGLTPTSLTKSMKLPGNLMNMVTSARTQNTLNKIVAPVSPTEEYSKACKKFWKPHFDALATDPEQLAAQQQAASYKMNVSRFSGGTKSSSKK